MNIKIKPFLIILVVLIVSCKNNNKNKDIENELPNSAQNEILGKENQENKIEKIIAQLQGKWKEIEYPYRKAEFVSSTVKFVEEGTEDEPKFEKFKVSEDCQFDNNNIRDLKSSDIILTLPETNRCEKLKVSSDTLTLSGFSTNNNDDYSIIYIKLK